MEDPMSRQSVNPLFDGASTGIVLGSLAEMLPPIAAALSIVWFVLRLVESRAARYYLRKLTGFDIPWLKEDRNEDHPERGA